MYLTRIVARSGALSAGEVRQQRDACYRAAMPATAVQKAEAWALAYAYGIESEAEAGEALVARRATTDARWSMLSLSVDAALGRALWLGGERDEALSHLARTAARCDRFPSIFVATRSDLLFGRALEARGDRGGACGAYATVIARWGGAKPRSVTAEVAKRRATALGCAAAPRRK